MLVILLLLKANKKQISAARPAQHPQRTLGLLVLGVLGGLGGFGGFGFGVWGLYKPGELGESSHLAAPLTETSGWNHNYNNGSNSNNKK